MTTENLKYMGWGMSQHPLSSTYTTQNGLEMNPGFHIEIMATNHLSHDTANGICNILLQQAW